jgi:hypothetical protein
MTSILKIASFIVASYLPLSAEIVIITSVPEETRPIAPLTSLGGIPLDGTAQVRVGAFPGVVDDALLDLAATAGLSGVSGAFSPFGATASIGQGVGGAAGGFEISIRDTTSSSLAGEVISLLIQTQNGEFLVARFSGRLFQLQTATGLEPLHSLHLADAHLIAGNRVGSARFSTSPAPAVASFTTWIAGFPTITNPALKLPEADADGDGRSNFLEYATGGNPSVAGDAAACKFQREGDGSMWVQFYRMPGLGSVRYTPQFSADLQSPWLETTLPAEPDPGNAAILRLPLTLPLAPAGFFRLAVE